MPTINAPIETELSANNAEGERVWVHIWEMGMDALSKVVKMGRVQTSRDFIFILNAIRQALHR